MAAWVTYLIIVLGLTGLIWSLVDQSTTKYVTYLLAIQFGSFAFGAMATVGSLETLSIAAGTVKVADDACGLLVAVAAKVDSSVALPALGRELSAPPCRGRLVGQPFVWKTAGLVAFAAEIVSLIGIYLAFRGMQLYPHHHMFLSGALVNGLVPASGSLWISGSRQQPLAEALRRGVAAHRSLSGLVLTEAGVEPLRLVHDEDQDRGIGGSLHHLKRTAD